MFKTIRQNFQRYTVLRVAIYILAGIAIILNPRAVFHFIGYLITAYFVLIGILNFLEANKYKKQTGTWDLNLVSALFYFIVALIIFVFAPAIVSILPIVLGLVIVLKSMFQLFVGLNTKSKGWIVYSILLLIGGLVLLFNPFKSVMILFQLFGGILLFMGISEIVSYFQGRNRE